MVWFSRSELKKLAALCDDRRYTFELIRDNDIAGANYDYGERCIAAHEVEYMRNLSAKLLEAAESGARRMEITI